MRRARAGLCTQPGKTTRTPGPGTFALQASGRAVHPGTDTSNADREGGPKYAAISCRRQRGTAPRRLSSMTADRTTLLPLVDLDVTNNSVHLAGELCAEHLALLGARTRRGDGDTHCAGALS